MIDPEPDRYEIAAREDGWQIPTATLSLLDAVEGILDQYSCKNGHHTWEAVSTGRLEWSADQVACEECGCTAQITIVSGPDPHY